MSALDQWDLLFHLLFHLPYSRSTGGQLLSHLLFLPAGRWDLLFHLPFRRGLSGRESRDSLAVGHDLWVGRSRWWVTSTQEVRDVR